MSWWRFLVCMIFCARVNRIILMSPCTQISHENVLLSTRLQMNADIKGCCKYLKIQLCVAWFSSLQWVDMKNNVRIFNVIILGIFVLEEKATEAVVCTVAFTENLAWAYSEQLVTSWPFVSLSQSVWGELDLLLEGATLHCSLGICLPLGQKKHPGLCGHFAVRTSHWLTFKNAHKKWPLDDTHNAEEANFGCLCHFYMWAMLAEWHISWYFLFCCLIPPEMLLI